MQDESENLDVTIVGVGTAGLTVINHFYNLGVKNILPIICHADADLLRASPVPDKVLFEANRADDDAEWHLTEALNEVEHIGELVVIVTDLSNPDDCRLASALVRIMTVQDRFTVAVIGSPIYADPIQTELAGHTLLELQKRVNSLWVYKLEPTDHHQPVQGLADAVNALATFCQSLIGNVDFLDFKKVVGKARMAVATATYKGENRAADAINDLTTQLKRQIADGPELERILLLTISGDDKPLLLREQVTLSQGISELVGKDIKLFKMGLVTDYRFDEWISVTILAGMPFG